MRVTRQGMTFGLTALAAAAVLGLAAGRTFASHATCNVNGLTSIFKNQVSASSNAVDVNVECNNVDLRTRTGPEAVAAGVVEPGAPGFDPSQLLAFAALDRCIGPLTGTATLESGTSSLGTSNNNKADCQTNGGVVIHGPFSALGTGAVTNNMFGRIITVNGFDAVSFLKGDDGNGIAFGNNSSADVVAMQGIIVPCTNPLQSAQSGLFTCDLAMLASASGSATGFDANGVQRFNVDLNSFNMAANTASPFTISPAITVGTGGNNFLVSTNNSFQFINAGGAAPVSGSICDNVQVLNNGAIGKGAATNLTSISNMITPSTGVSCGVQLITQNVPNASGVEDPTGPGAVNGAGGGVSLVSMVFSWFTQQAAGGLISVAGAIVTANTDPRVNFVQLVSQGAFNLNQNGFFRYINGTGTFPVATYPTGRTLSLSSVINGPNAGDPSACIPATATNTCAP